MVFSAAHCAVRNEFLEPTFPRTPVALFVALTRPVREAPATLEARDHVFAIVDRMAHAVYLPTFAAELDALITCATREPRFSRALQPFWAELRALSQSTSRRANGGPNER
jgi:hypothetical protein